MSLTVALALASLGATTIGTGMDVYGKRMQGNIAARSGQINAWSALREADRIEERLGLAQRQVAKQAQYDQAQRSAVLTEFGGGKSEEIIMNAADLEAAIEQNMIAMDAYDHVRSIKQGGLHERASGQAARRASYWDAGTSLLTGAGKLFGQAQGSASAIKSLWDKGETFDYMQPGDYADLPRGNGSRYARAS